MVKLLKMTLNVGKVTAYNERFSWCSTYFILKLNLCVSISLFDYKSSVYIVAYVYNVLHEAPKHGKNPVRSVLDLFKAGDNYTAADSELSVSSLRC